MGYPPPEDDAISIHSDRFISRETQDLHDELAYHQAVMRECQQRLMKSYRLTSREIEVVEKILGGCTISTAAKQLFIADSTVKYHLGNIYKKVGVKSRSELLSIFLS